MQRCNPGRQVTAVPFERPDLASFDARTAVGFVTQCAGCDLCLMNVQTETLNAEHGRIIIAPSNRPSYELHDLVARITRENRHAPLDWGSAVGREETP